MRFRDGPAAGVALVCARAPIFLRVVQDTSTRAFDVLDQPEDTPRPSEVVHVYRRVPGTFQTPAHVCGRRGLGRHGRGLGCTAVAFGDYEHVPMDDTEPLRDTETWRAWASAQEHPDAS